MAELTIGTAVWRDLVQVARKRKQKPEALAAQVLREFIQRQADEDLLARSDRAAQRTSFLLEESEERVRRYRNRKQTP